MQPDRPTRAVRCQRLRDRGAAVAAFLAVATLAAACGGSAANAPVPAHPARAGKQTAMPAFLRLIPADTPYVFAGLEPLPEAYAQRQYLDHAAQYERLFRLLVRARTRHPAAFSRLGWKARLLFAVIDELGGKLSPASLARLGITLTPRYALYGIGLLPVFRVELGDPQEFRAAAARIVRRVGVTVRTRRIRGQSYWEFPHAVSGKISVAAAVVGRELVVAAVTDGTRDDVLPLAFGLTRPRRSLADTHALRQALAAYHLIPRGAAGYVDLVQIAEQATGGGHGVAAEVARALALGSAGPACRREIPDLLEVTPRLVFGTQELSDRALSAALVLELRPDVARALAGMRAAVPGLSVAETRGAKLAMGVGLSLRRFGAFAVAAARKLAKRTFRCGRLAQVPTYAGRAASLLAALTTPPLSTVTGGVVVIRRGDFSTPIPTHLRGLAILGSDDPQRLLKLAARTFPPLAALHIKAGAAPVRLSMSPLLLRLAATDTAIGLSFGGGTAPQLMSMLGSPPDAGSPLFLMRFDDSFLEAMQRRNRSPQVSRVARLDPELARALGAVDDDSATYSSGLVTADLDRAGVIIKVRLAYRRPRPGKAAPAAPRSR